MIICKTPREIEIMREAGRIVALTHQELKNTLNPVSRQKNWIKLPNVLLQSKVQSHLLKGIMVFAGAFAFLSTKSWFTGFREAGAS